MNTGLFGWQDYAVVDGQAIGHRVEEIDLPLSSSLGVLGLNGVTAHYGLLQLGQPKAGETVVVSTAAGSVGSCVGQIAKLRGCRTVGIAGGAVKRELCLERFGFDAAVDYKAPDFAAELAQACAGGVDENGLAGLQAADLEQGVRRREPARRERRRAW